MKNLLNSMLVILILISTSYSDNEQKIIKKMGFGFCLGGGYGLGISGYYNISDKIQLRPGIGIGLSLGAGDSKSNSFLTDGDTVAAIAGDTYIKADVRYYPNMNMYLASGINGVKRTAIVSLSSILGTTYTAEKMVWMLEMPIKIGLELGRASILAAYLEIGYNLQITKRNEHIYIPLETDFGNFIGDYKFGTGHITLGFGVTLNL